MNTCLIVGATGLLGSEVAYLLRKQTCAVRGLARASSDPLRIARLCALGVELQFGDLRDFASLERACLGVHTVVSTASAAMPRQAGDRQYSVDGEGQLVLIEAAKRAGVGKFVYVSLPEMAIDFKLQRAKRRAEACLRASGMIYTILQPTNFMEVWLSPRLGFDPRAGRIRVAGDGSGKVNWISYRDVARFVTAAAVLDVMNDRTLSLGGPDALSLSDVIAIARELGAPAPETTFVGEQDLEAALARALSEFDEAAPALMLNAARGLRVEPRVAQAFVPGRLRSVREYLATLLPREETCHDHGQ